MNDADGVSYSAGAKVTVSLTGGHNVTLSAFVARTQRPGESDEDQRKSVHAGVKSGILEQAALFRDLQRQAQSVINSTGAPTVPAAPPPLPGVPCV